MSRTRVHVTVLALFSLLVGAVFVMIPVAGHAQENETVESSTTTGFGTGKLGLGLGKGTLASGLSAKMYVTPGTAFQAHAGYTNGWGWGNCRGGRGRYDYNCNDFYGFGLNVDYVGTFADIVQVPAGQLFSSIGGGGAISSGGPFGNGLVAANGVLELGWHFSAVPVELVGDWRPFLGMGSGGPFFSLFDFGFSGRFYF